MPAALLDRPAPRGKTVTVTDARWAEIVAQLTRREFIGAGAAGALTLGLATVGAPAADAASGGATRVVPSANGPVRVPADPQRVISIDDYSMATLFDLDFPHVVGVYSAGAEYVEPQYLKRWRSIAKISAGTVGGAVNVEKVAELQPDLIIGIDASNPPYAQLKQVAPTVIMPFSKAKIPWSAMATDTARTINQTAALAALRRRYDQTAARIRHTYAAVLARTRWNMVQGGFNQGEFWLYGPQSPIGVILARAGVRFASASAGVKGNGDQPLSYERISELRDADAIYYYATNAGKPANLGPALFSQQLFKQLPAVKAGHTYGTVYFLPSGYGDAIDALKALESALQKLQGSRA